MLVATLSRLWICWFAPDAHLDGSAGEHGLTFFFCQSFPIGVFGEAVHGIVRLLLSMRDCGRRMTFIGLTSSERLPSSLDRGRAAPPDGDPRPGRRARDLGDASDGISSRDTHGASSCSPARWHQPSPQRPQRTGAAQLLVRSLLLAIAINCSPAMRVERIHFACLFVITFTFLAVDLLAE